MQLKRRDFRSQRRLWISKECNSDCLKATKTKLKDIDQLL